MAQIFRAYKSEIPALVRIYCKHGYHQRCRRNYYEVLCVSPNATQKEIKDAFIKLSKKTHPDSGDKGNHDDFVLINEAYMVLSKKGKRQEYDTILKCTNIYNTHSVQHNNYQQYKKTDFERAYANYRNWEAQQRNETQMHWDHTQQNVKTSITICLFIISIGVAIQLIIMDRSAAFKKHLLLERTAKYQEEYEKTRENAKCRSNEEQLEHIINLSKKYGFAP